MGTPDPGEGQIVENAIDLVGNEPLCFGCWRVVEFRDDCSRRSFAAGRVGCGSSRENQALVACGLRELAEVMFYWCRSGSEFGA
jgi:hypothetical protein